MSENKTITLVFQNDKKVVKFPNNFTDLKSFFSHVFNPENIDECLFYYEGENNIEIYIKDENSFKEFLQYYGKKKIDKIYIKKKEIITPNLLQSELFLSKSESEENQLSAVVNNPEEINETSNLNLNFGDDEDKKNTFVKTLEQKEKEMTESYNINSKNSSKIDNNNEELNVKIEKIDIEQKLKEEDDNKKELKSKINQLEIKISKLEEEKSNLNNQNQIYQSKIAEFEKKFQEQNSSYQSKISLIEGKNSQIENDYKSKIIIMEKELKDKEILYQKKLSEIEEKNNKLNNDNSSYQIKISQINKELEEQKSSNQKLKEKNITLENNNLCQKSELEIADKEKSKLNNKIIFLKECQAKEEKDFQIKENNYKIQISQIQKENQDIKILENNLKNKLSQLEQENIQLKTEKINHEKNICKTIHNGTKCMTCFKSPIIGYRYECSECTGYNLCQECHEKNAETGAHQHFFYKYKDNIVNTNIYSYKCLSPNNKLLLFKGRSNTKMKILLQNDKLNTWPDNARLVWDINNSEIQTDDVPLKGLKASEVHEFEIYFKNLQNLDVKEYKVGFDFNVNGKNYGNKLWVYIVVQDGQPILNNFKAKYKVPDDYKDDIICEVLEEKNCNFEKAFFKLYFK